MGNHDSGSVAGFILTTLLWTFAHITGSDVALVVTILAGISTLAVNIQKYNRKK